MATLELTFCQAVRTSPDANAIGTRREEAHWGYVPRVGEYVKFDRLQGKIIRVTWARKWRDRDGCKVDIKVEDDIDPEMTSERLAVELSNEGWW